MELNEEKATEMWMDHLAGNLSTAEQAELKQYLSVHPQLQEELRVNSQIWDKLGQVDTPQPSSAMDQQFESMLIGYQTAHRQSTNDWWQQLVAWWLASWKVGLGALSIGLLIGTFLIKGPDQNVDALSAEVLDIKEMLLLTMIDKPQAQDRIKAVNLTRELPKADTRVTKALIITLNNDPSINVRLAALEALLAYGDQSNIREALIQSIGTQDSPLLQVALADAMVMLQEKAAVGPLNKVLQSPELNESVKAKLETTIATLHSI